MVCHVVVPGIFGTEMVDVQGRTVWPPGLMPGHPMSSTELVNILMSETTKPGKVIRTAACAGNVYGPLIDHLGKRPGTVVPMAYDWRIDIRTAAAGLAAVLAKVGPTEPIVLIAHSMGGLVTRWLLECGLYADQPWFARVKLAVMICSPHFGAPLAVFRLLGQNGIPVILPSWAMESLNADPAHFPAGYQLLPAPDIDCVSRAGQTSLDVYAAFPGLKSQGVAAARAVFDVLDRFQKPASITYCAAYGRGQKVTVSGIILDGLNATEGTDDGDGTVPVWSGDPTRLSLAAKAAFTDIAPFVGDHVGILSNARFLGQLDSWLNAPAMDAPDPVVA